MKIGKSSHTISGAFVFLLLGLFAVFSSVMVLMCAKAYRGTVERSSVHNSLRIASSYIRTMLRSDDELGTLGVEDLNGVRTITMLNTYDDESYVTRLYVYDGMLREWFSIADMPFEPKNGETVCALDSMKAEMKDGLLTVLVELAGMEIEIDFAPRAVDLYGVTEK